MREEEPMREWENSGFKLTMWGTDRQDTRGQTVIAYEFSHEGKVVFSGEDFCGSPMNCDDSDETVAALLSFLALRPGDTDREYFEKYTEEQMEFAETHGEYLGILAMELEESASEA